MRETLPINLNVLGITVVAPSVEQLKEALHGGRWFSGASIGQDHGFACNASIGTALSRLIRHFGIPNSPHCHGWGKRFLQQRDKSTWEYILRVNDSFFFAVYDYKGKVAVGYRLISPRGVTLGSQQDFDADLDTCYILCRYIEAVVNTPSEMIQIQGGGADDANQYLAF